MQLDIVNHNNEKVGALTVSDDVFGGRVNTDLIWESVVHENAGKHRGTHQTKNRANVSGSGKSRGGRRAPAARVSARSATPSGATGARCSARSRAATTSRFRRKSGAARCARRSRRNSRAARS